MSPQAIEAGLQVCVVLFLPACFLCAILAASLDAFHPLLEVSQRGRHFIQAQLIDRFLDCSLKLGDLLRFVSFKHLFVLLLSLVGLCAERLE